MLLNIKNKTLELLYIAPERLDTKDWLDIQKACISMVVIDEAHCISTWGHDFRPNYRFFLPFIKQNQYFRSIPILALTATANKEVQDDIKKQIVSFSSFFNHYHHMHHRFRQSFKKRIII